MEIDIPAVPGGILTLLAFFAPYAIAVINLPRWSGAQRRVISVLISALLGVIVWVIYFAMTGDGLHDWPTMILLAVVITQTSYALVTKKTANTLNAKTHPQAHVTDAPGE